MRRTRELIERFTVEGPRDPISGKRKPIYRTFHAPNTREGATRGTQPRVPAWRAVRTTRWLYIEYKGGQRELYDMRRDPWQLRSRVRDPRLRVRVRTLRRILGDLRRCRGRSCASWGGTSWRSAARDDHVARSAGGLCRADALAAPQRIAGADADADEPASDPLPHASQPPARTSFRGSGRYAG